MPPGAPPGDAGDREWPRSRPEPKYALRITFGVIWRIDAVLKWLPGFRSGYLGMIAGAGIWAAGEGFGGPYTSGASDIGTAVAGNSPSSAAPSSRQRPSR